MTNYYVYYRADEARAAMLRPRIDRLFATVEKECGVRGRWMRRRDDPSTWMEVYESVADEAKFEALLAQETAGFGLDRRIERFICA